MSLEQKISELTTQTLALTTTLERFLAAGGMPAAATAPSTAAATNGASTAPTTTTEAPKKPGRPAGAKAPTMVEAKAAAFAVKDALGKEVAQRLISEHGAASLAELDPKKFVAFIAACKAEIEAGEPAPADDEL